MQSRFSARLLKRWGRAMSNYRVTFAKDIMGVPFTIASILVRHAHSPERAQRAAEPRLMRRRHIQD
jgi:hypothetical protein